MSEQATYKISNGADGGKCQCGPAAAAHGSNGFICAVGSCKCRKYIAAAPTTYDAAVLDAVLGDVHKP